MTLAYEFRRDDLLAGWIVAARKPYYRWHRIKSPMIVGFIAWCAWGSAALLLIADRWLYSAVAAAVGFALVLVAVALWRNWPRMIAHDWLRADGLDRTLQAAFGHMELEATPSGLATRNRYGHTETYWSAIHELEIDEAGLTVHGRWQSNLAYVSRAAVAPEDFQRFAAVCMGFLADSRRAKPV